MGGTTYAFLDRGPSGAEAVSPLLLTRPDVARTATTTVAGIHPDVEEVPLNLLRCYVHFSAPMSEGFAADAVGLYDADSGKPLEGALLSTTAELWDPGRTRLTVLLDPGRIKRGLAPHTEAGYPLVEGRTIALVVGTSFLDATGAPLVSATERRFRVGPAIRSRVDPGAWTIAPPRPLTREPLLVRADRPLDHALALRCIAVADAHGRKVPGSSSLTAGEQEWVFTPASAWTAGPSQLLVAPALEDVAGNSVTRVFDRDLADPSHDPVPIPDVAIDVTV